MPRMVEMLRAGNARSMPVVVRAIGKLGDRASIELLLPLLARPEKEVRVETIQALASLADEQIADQIRVQLQAQSAQGDETVARAAVRALTELEVRFSSGSVEDALQTSGNTQHPSRMAARGQATARTLLIPEKEVAQVVHQVANAVAR